MTGPLPRPPQSYERGGRRALDRIWLQYIEQTADTGSGSAVAGLAGFHRGIAEFNAGRYFDSHETWEAAWRQCPYPEKLFMLGLTKLGAGFAHLQRRNVPGARHSLEAGLACLRLFPAFYAGMDVEHVRRSVRLCLAGDPEGPSVLPMTINVTDSGC